MNNISIITINEDRWIEAKELRIKLLKEVPEAYGSSFEEEVNKTDEEWKEFLFDKDSKFFYAEIDGKLVGVMKIIFNNALHTKHIAELVSVYVDNTYRGNGIGSMLLDKVLQEAKERNILKVELTVVTTQASAYHLYEKFGFIDTGYAEKAIYASGKFYDERYMEKLI